MEYLIHIITDLFLILDKSNNGSGTNGITTTFSKSGKPENKYYIQNEKILFLLFSVKFISCFFLLFDIAGKNAIHIHCQYLLWNRPEKLLNGSLLYLFLKLVQMFSLYTLN